MKKLSKCGKLRLRGVNLVPSRSAETDFFFFNVLPLLKTSILSKTFLMSAVSNASGVIHMSREEPHVEKLSLPTIRNLT